MDSTRGRAAAAALAAAILAGGTQSCAVNCSGAYEKAALFERERPSGGGTFYVVYSPTPDPIPLNQLFRLEVAVYEGSDRFPAADTELDVRSRMPEHEHGMNLVPEVRALGGGRFAVEGMLFHMPGRWQLEVEVRRADAAERAVFEVQVE